MTISTRVFRVLGLSAGVAALAGCQSGAGGDPLANFLTSASGAPAAVAVSTAIDVPDCPPVDVTETGASKKRGAVQVSISNVARECSGRPDGSVVVKVGIEGRALAGPGGGSGRFDEPVYIVLKRGDRVLAQRSRRVAIAIPAGDNQGSFTVVEDGLAVPPGIGGEFEIEAGLGTAGQSAASSRPMTRIRSRLPTRS